ncbi:CLUMA_CG004839, isoform A [Clunio marinus]|uniref:CLUMA_CG004839, isoform A n=1 Tax=Clunio marinus TaxID=568069 RepID=A0A1J1HUC4_9DIPT|nr:CLUMA_CG004839, isoform A [Clunio marinus]
MLNDTSEINQQSMPVRNFLRRQQDVNNLAYKRNSTEKPVNLGPERPISEYDNITHASVTQYPFADLKFRFDYSPSTSTIMNNLENSSDVRSNNNKETTTLPVNHHQYENVLDTLQLRNQQRESDQQVKMNQNDAHSSLSPQRSVMSDAKSSFFGLNKAQEKSSTQEEFEKLIDDMSNARILLENPNPHYVNVPSNETTERKEKDMQTSKEQSMSATSSASGSSSTTATPSSSPLRQDRKGNCRKNSESSSRSKSPKFMLPETTTLPSTPSQAVYMSTTVPQNIKGQNIMGRHKPTRTSLRHSRMIVTSKHFHGPRYTNLLNIHFVWLAKFFLFLKIVIGISLLTLGGWICLFANSTPIQQNPFWSGLIIIISGLLGLYLLSLKRTRSKLKANFFWFLKMNASVIIVMSVFLTTLALIYASFHFVSLKSDRKKCFPENVFINSSSCICVFNVNSDFNISREFSVENHTDSSGIIDLPNDGNIVHFRDLSCNELETWTHILLTSMILNFLGLFFSVCYMTQFIFGCKRRKRFYTTVRTAV